ncbi:MAG: hypothetical protein AMXMBFR82_08640 [Candidatus Hydrogenedentota bacterium]
MNARQKPQLDEPRFVDGLEMIIAGQNIRYDFETRVNIPTQWARFAPQIGKVPGQVGNNSYGVSWNYDGKEFDYLCGVEVSDTSGLPENFEHVRLAPRRYAVFTHHGDVSTLPDMIQRIWAEWLPASGHKAAQAPCFERYTEEFCPDTGTGGMEIWIPIQS